MHTLNPFDSTISFEEKALQIFEHQKRNNSIYKKFCEALVVREVSHVNEIPLIPIQAFKDTRVFSGDSRSNLYFESSGTSGMNRSRHYVADSEVYRRSIIEGMSHFYRLDDYVILAYTPGYTENPHSSLVWMLKTLIEREISGLSRFLEIGKPLGEEIIDKIESSGKKVLLFGAAFGLLDLIELGSPGLPKDSIVLETGGMKTHRREVEKEELHQQLAEGFRIPTQNVHSEYGMTELLSQAYSQGTLWFDPVPWMKISIRNPQNPMEHQPYGNEGIIGVIDLANIHSCSFILTGDRGIQNEKGQFQVLGRWNPLNLRGCNFLIDS